MEDSLFVIAGGTRSADYPTTEGVLEPTEPDTAEHDANGFITIMNPYEEVIASTLFGVQSVGTGVRAMKVDSAGISFYGRTLGNGIPLSANAFDTVLNDDGSQLYDAFVARLSPDLRILEYGSYLGGGGFRICVWRLLRQQRLRVDLW